MKRNPFLLPALVLSFLYLVVQWKKLIRVLSHELNNSLGPISSLVKSGEDQAAAG
jgi:hypothetical protein